MNCPECGKTIEEHDEDGLRVIDGVGTAKGLLCPECGEKEVLRMSIHAAEYLKEKEAEKDYKLKPCPFCGGEVEWRGYSIQCPSCSAFMAFGFTGNGWREATVNAYNSRFIRITEEK